MISYNLPSPAYVGIDVYTSAGEKVATLVEEIQEAGFHVVEWDGRDFAGCRMQSGWYLYKFESDTCQHVRLVPLVPAPSSVANP